MSVFVDVVVGVRVIPASWNAKRMAPLARFVHPFDPTNVPARSFEMVDQISGQVPASARAVKARRAKVFPTILLLLYEME